MLASEKGPLSLKHGERGEQVTSKSKSEIRER